MDDALRRTVNGKNYRVKVSIKQSYELSIKAIDEDDIEEILDEIVKNDLDLDDNVSIEIEEIIEEER